MIVAVFGSWIIAVILFYVAQRPTLSNSMKLVLRILGFVFLGWPLLSGFIPSNIL